MTKKEILSHINDKEVNDIVPVEDRIPDFNVLWCMIYNEVISTWDKVDTDNSASI